MRLSTWLRTLLLRAVLPLMLITAGTLIGCGGSSGGNGTDTGNGNGNGVDTDPDDPVEEEATLAYLQEEIFGAICAQCHTGASAPEGLMLSSEQESFDNLVGEPSAQMPDLLRVDPGNPDDSYMVMKIEGDPGIVGGQMPLGQPSLSDEQIALVRDWITNGAPREGTGDTPTSVGLTSSKLTPQEVELQLRFSRPVQTQSLDEQTVSVYFLNGDTRWLAGPDTYVLALDGQQLNVSILRLDIPVTAVELRVNDPALGSLVDHNNRVIDGDNSGVDGGVFHYVYTF